MDLLDFLSFSGLWGFTRLLQGFIRVDRRFHAFSKVLLQNFYKG